jgi:hypothetical protein
MAMVLASCGAGQSKASSARQPGLDHGDLGAPDLSEGWCSPSAARASSPSTSWPGAQRTRVQRPGPRRPALRTCAVRAPSEAAPRQEGAPEGSAFQGATPSSGRSSRRLDTARRWPARRRRGAGTSPSDLDVLRYAVSYQTAEAGSRSAAQRGGRPLRAVRSRGAGTCGRASRGRGDRRSRGLHLRLRATCSPSAWTWATPLAQGPRLPAGAKGGSGCTKKVSLAPYHAPARACCGLTTAATAPPTRSTDRRQRARRIGVRPTGMGWSPRGRVDRGRRELRRPPARRGRRRASCLAQLSSTLRPARPLGARQPPRQRARALARRAGP